MNVTWLILAAPLAGALVLSDSGRRVGRSSGVLASVAIAVALSPRRYRALWLVRVWTKEAVRPQVHLFTWAQIGPVEIGADLRWDPLAAVMALTSPASDS